MKELEDLKNKWAKQDFSQSYSKEEIKGFLQKKSTHSIKWIDLPLAPLVFPSVTSSLQTSSL